VEVIEMFDFDLGQFEIQSAPILSTRDRIHIIS
jgi:hypothetical protein